MRKYEAHAESFTSVLVGDSDTLHSVWMAGRRLPQTHTTCGIELDRESVRNADLGDVSEVTCGRCCRSLQTEAALALVAK